MAEGHEMVDLHGRLYLAEGHGHCLSLTLLQRPTVVCARIVGSASEFSADLWHSCGRLGSVCAACVTLLMLTKKNVPALASTSSEMFDIGLLWEIEEFVLQLKLDRQFFFKKNNYGSSRVLTKRKKGSTILMMLVCSS